MAPASRIEKNESKLLSCLRGGLRRADLDADSALIAAVSGGADSTAMLALLASLPADERPRLSVAYINHGIEPARHIREHQHVARQAASCGLPFVAIAIENGGRHDEATLRRARYQALEDHARTSGATAIATAHTREDQIETMLGRFIRGAGRRGLAGIADTRGSWVRPLLDAGREDLRNYLRARDIAWCDDPGNDDKRYTRNRIRHVLLPKLHEEAGDVGFARIVRGARRLREEESFLEREAARYRAFVERDRHLDLVALAEVPDALKPRLLRSWLTDSGVHGPVELDHLEAVEVLLGAAGGSSRVDLPGLVVTREYESLRADIRWEPAAAPAYALTLDEPLRRLPCVVRAPGGEWELSLGTADNTAMACHRAPYFEEVDIPARLLARDPVLRPIASGDRTGRVRGRMGSRKLHDLLVDARIPGRMRRIWPVLTCERRIVWVPGLGAEPLADPSTLGDRNIRVCWRMHLR